ncbi:serpin family protein [Jonesiaceae bacterium BS-20]|uniref:Serpin family protein n=1 Tax=Jonesiaceae bacterium BS-20 TaxID=3120821 RepID=A0AAU7DUC8_9MICO
MTPNMTRPVVAAATLAALLGVTACAGAAPVELEISDVARKVVTVSQVNSVDEVVAATDQFGLSLLKSAPPEQNAVVSPASAVIALSMLAEGAAGETASQFDAVLGAAGSDRTDAVNALLAALEEYSGDPAVVQDKEPPEQPVLHVANQVVLDSGFTARPQFLDALGAGYGAGVLVTDLSNKQGKKTLDTWVKENTGGLIEESAITSRDDLRLVLQNATVFAAAWQMPFQEYSTAQQQFTLGAGDLVDVDMMSQVAEFRYAEAQGWQAVRLPYTSGFHMDVLLPPQGTDPGLIPAELKQELSAKLSDASAVRVDLSIPKVDIESGALDLKPALESVGLGGLFAASGPDFSGISEEDLYLAQAVQQAVLAIDEAGTIAVAVTELAMTGSSAPLAEEVKVFRADRPFLVAIEHTDTAWPLFVAAIRDPRN